MKTKYFRSYHLPFSPGATSDDKISKDYSFLENKPVVITEKLDGQNDGQNSDGVYARSHATFTEHKWDRAIWDIHSRIRDQIQSIKDLLEIEDLDPDNDQVFLFGENMYAIHSLEYKKLESYYYVFGIRVGHIWLSWDEVEEMCELLALPTVPVIKKGIFSDIKKEVESIVIKPSLLDAYDTKTGQEMMEGVVVRNAARFNNDDSMENLLKWVRPNHVNSDEHWTRNWKKANLIWQK